MKFMHAPPSGIVDASVQVSLGSDWPSVPREVLRDEFSLDQWPGKGIVGYLFQSAFAESEEARLRRAQNDRIGSDLDSWLEHLDQHGVAIAGCDVRAEDPNELYDRIEARADRVYACVRVNPHDGMKGLRRLTELAERYSCVRAIAICPFAIHPFLHVNSKEYYPIFAKCIELGLTAFVHVGFPGPRVPAWVQDPIHIDEVCWFFPELKIVMRHGGEPWADVCVKMLLRWPNLYYATSAMAPRFYPPTVIDYLKTRGSDRILFSGYWPTIPYEQVFAQLEQLDLPPDTWRKFLSDNARGVFGLPPT